MDKKIMKVDLDKNSGFCFGVVNAIDQAEKHLENDDILYCLGDIVHNGQEVDRLAQKGLVIIDHKELENLKDSKVLIRAHGEPPETYTIAKKNNIQLIDATCPVVLKLQQRIKNTYLNENESQLVIFGKKGHAEVNGLVGQTNNNAIVISNIDEIDKIDYSKDIFLYSQTTKNPDDFIKLKEKIQEKIAGTDTKFTAHDTICRSVSNRTPQLKEFAVKHDVIIFVSGKKSSNGNFLYSICKSVNEQSYFISHKGELENDWFKNAKSVGVCGATSTPLWLMEEVAKYITNYELRITD